MITITITTRDHGKNDCLMLLEYLEGSMDSLGFDYRIVNDDSDQESDDIQLPIDPIGEALDEQENDPDKKIFDEITENEYNDLFQQDRQDQFREIEKELEDRSNYYQSDRPVDP